MADARSAETSSQSRRCSGRDPHPHSLPSRCPVFEARLTVTAVLSERRKQSGTYALRVALQQLPRDPGARSGSQARQPELFPDAAEPLSGRLRGGRINTAVPPALVLRLPVVAGVLHLPGKILFLRSAGTG